MPSKFIHEECELADPIGIANAFNSYFANIGKKNSSLLVNDRPISLLPTISMVFERVIHDQMY